MFSIYVNEDGEGRIICGKFSEEFEVNEDVLGKNSVGNEAWKFQLESFLSSNASSCFLYIARHSHRTSNFWRAWVIFRDRNKIFLTEYLCIFSWLLKLLITVRLIDETGTEKWFQRRFEAGLPLSKEISKWLVDETELQKFVSVDTH